MNKWQHIEEMQNTLEELTGMQDRILDVYDSSRSDHVEILKQISELKQKFEDLIWEFETKIP
jgi:hypothetical protein